MELKELQQKTKNNNQPSTIMTLEEAQKQVDQWVKTYGVRYFSELTNMAVLTEEVGELARVMARKYGEQSFKEGEKDNLADEMADILWVLTCLANQTGVDLTEAMEINFAKKIKEDSINNEILSIKVLRIVSSLSTIESLKNMIFKFAGYSC